jgi:adenylylsulfate kinase-like enzyme
MPQRGFVEIYVQCDLSVCEQRDPKGLYKKARASGIAEFTGITSPYEPPQQPELTLENNGAWTVKEQATRVLEFLQAEHYLSLSKI